jgi:large subunit ribosomal protein L10
MSKPVKNLIAKQYQQKFADIDGAVLIDVRGIKSNDNNTLRAKLRQNKIKVTVVRNALARRALIGTRIEKLGELLSGPCGVAYGGESVVGVARTLIEQVKEMEWLRFRGAVMDGVLFTAEQVEALSKYPTRAEAQAQVVTLILSPARKLAGQVLGPGRKVASLVKAVELKREKEAAPAAA